MSDIAAPAAPPSAPAAPPVSDPGDISPPIERAAPKPAAPEKTFAQKRFEQDQPSGDGPAADPQQPAPAAAEKVKIGKYEVSEAEIAAMMERQARDDLRAATVPPTPADYKLAIPEGMKLPGDQDFRFDEAGNKAAFDAARAWAHGKGMSQSDFAEMLGLYASQEAQEHLALAERSRQEVAKIGINAPQRVDAVGRWITGMVGEADAAPIKATLVTDAHVRFYETIMSKLSSQGSASYSQSHRVPPAADPIPNYDGMTFAQRREAQDQFARRGGR